MGTNAWPLDAIASSPSYTGRILRQTIGVLLGVKTGSRPLGARTGVAPGTGSWVTATASHAYVQAHAGVLDLESAAIAGPYMYANDAQVDMGAMTAADATNPRITSIFVQIADNAEDGLGTAAVTFLMVDGSPGATTTTRGVAGGPPNYPNSRCMELAQILVPNTSGGGTGSATVTLVAPYTSTLGGLVICRSSGEYPASPYAGLEIFDIALGYKLRYSGSMWVPADYGLNAVQSASQALTTSFVTQTGCSLTVPPGRWLAMAKGNFDVSTSAERQYTAQLTDGVNADTAAARSSGSTLGFRGPVALLLPINNTSPRTLSLQAKCDVVDGTQLFWNGRVILTAVPGAGW